MRSCSLSTERCENYPGVAKLVSRLIWGQETVRSSRTTRTKTVNSLLRFDGFLLEYRDARSLAARFARVSIYRPFGRTRRFAPLCDRAFESHHSDQKPPSLKRGSTVLLLNWRERTVSCRALCARFNLSALRPDAALHAAVRPCVRVAPLGPETGILIMTRSGSRLLFSRVISIFFSQLQVQCSNATKSNKT